MKRLSKHTSPVLTLGYSCRDISGTKTTTQISQTSYKNGSGTSEVLPALGYTYDVLGNIKNVSSGGTLKQSYVYDGQNQLSSETIRGMNGCTCYGTYTYDMDGIRQSKTVSGNTTSYTTLAGKVVREKQGNVTTDYFYDNEGKPYKIVVKNNTATYTGYYVLNQQGDVIAILDAYGNVAVSYEYNAWGNILNESGTGTIQSMNLQSYNHLKYRGYFHDTETGFYYLENRYYDPVLGRFISPDNLSHLGESGDIVSYNLYTYCGNNPISRRDAGGNAWETVFDIISLGASIMDVAENPKDPWAWIGLAADAIDLIPVVTGIGETVRGLKVATVALENADTVKKGWKLGDNIRNLTKAGKIPSWSTVRQRFWKNEALNNSVKYSTSNVNRMKKGLAPIGSDGHSMELHHPKGRDIENFWNFYPVTYTEHKRIHYGR